MMKTMTSTNKGIAKMMTKASLRSMIMAMTMPPTHKKGARITKRISMATAYWQLIDITGNPVNQGGSTETVQLRVGKSGYPPEQGVAQLGAEALRGDRGDILANQGAEQADRDDSEHRPAHPQNIAGVPLDHAFIDDTGHQQRQIELKHRPPPAWRAAPRCTARYRVSGISPVYQWPRTATSGNRPDGRV